MIFWVFSLFPFDVCRINIYFMIFFERDPSQGNVKWSFKKVSENMF